MHLGINDGKITSQGATVANLYGNINKVSPNAGDSRKSLLTVAIEIEFHVTVKYLKDNLSHPERSCFTISIHNGRVRSRLRQRDL